MHQRPSEPILHVDLDAFYAGVEVLKDPSLAGKPVIVGGTGSRGVVASASYEARAFGVRSAMPAVRARRLCPDGIFLASDFEAYQAHSHRFREVLLSTTPLVEPISLDEAFLDVGGATRLFGAPPEVAQRIRDEVHREVGVTCSVGIAATKFVAKLASEACKPDGMLHVPASDTAAFLEPLPVRQLWGVGEKTGDLLGRLAIRTVGDLGRTPRSVLERLVGEAAAAHLTELAHGVDGRAVIPYEPPKSVSHEETFERDLDDDEEIGRELLHLSGRVAARLRQDGYRARTVTMKARLATFTTLTRSRTLRDPTDVGAELYRISLELYRSLP
ncbi:MAG TPA: DNA polymerase IV, partial [Actinomycetota bacterium]